ncbi:MULTISPECIES: 4Fe-4S single cluster domain-containing protein [unclassified Adlercreutzia]|uniref:4Fe-4S single cluster domain-containing protein n=1 Tax=unclassified Adlercreutzia TaxID=2636013 RepID=UPI0013EC3D00|nr:MULTISPECIES: 4Fe-4S single cluster domain-containing protein [unclassified Adlercreutzia]
MDIKLYGAVPDSIVDGPGLRYAVFVQGCSHACPGCHNPESQPREGGTLTTTDAVLAEIRANGLVHDVTLSGGEPFEQAAACAHLARQLKEEGYGVWAYTGYLYEDLVCVAEGGEGAPAEGAAPSAPAECATSAECAAPSAPAECATSAEGGASAESVAPSTSAGCAASSAPTAPAQPPALAPSTPQLDPAAVRALLDNVDVLVDGPFVQTRKSLSLKWCGSSNQRLIDVAATRAAGRVVTWEPPSFVPQKPPSW